MCYQEAAGAALWPQLHSMGRTDRHHYHVVWSRGLKAASQTKTREEYKEKGNTRGTLAAVLTGPGAAGQADSRISASEVAARESVRHCAHPRPASPRTSPFVYPRRKVKPRRSCLETTLHFYQLEVRSACPSATRAAARHQISAPQTEIGAPGSRCSVPCPERTIASPARRVFTATGCSRPKPLSPSP